MYCIIIVYSLTLSKATTFLFQNQNQFLKEDASTQKFPAKMFVHFSIEQKQMNLILIILVANSVTQLIVTVTDRIFF